MKNRNFSKSLIAGFTIAVLTLPSMAMADDARRAGEASAGELAKKTQNPISDLISVPFENSFGFGAGADGEFRYDLIIKPVIPM